MPSGFVTHSLGRAAEHVPGLRRVPLVKMLSLAELALVAHEHMVRLSPGERRRLLVLVRTGRGRRSRLTMSERAELARLLFKLEPRLFTGTAVERLSPVPLPRRVLFGPARRRRGF